MDSNVCVIDFYGDYYSSEDKSSINPFPLQVDKKWVVDDIEEMLSHYLLLTYNNFQRQKNKLALTIKVDMSQADIVNGLTIGSAQTLRYIRYCKIKNSDDDTPFYYFVTGMNIKSMKSVQLVLVMDTLNTCMTSVAGYRQLQFDNKTNVSRQHVDRYWKNWKKEGTDKDYYLRYISNIGNDINPTLYRMNLEKKVLDYLQPGDIGKNSWYLVYRTDFSPNDVEKAKQGNPIDCYLINDDKLKYQEATGSYSLSINEFKSNQGVFNTLGFVKSEGNTGTFSIDGVSYNMSNYDYIYIRIQGEGGTEMFRIIAGSGSNTQTSIPVNSSSNIIFSGDWSKGHFVDTTFSTTTNKYEPSNVYEAMYKIQNSNKTLNIASFGEGYTKGFKELDRTDSRLVKIICLPYSPMSYTINSNGVFTPSADWVLGTDYDIKDHMIHIIDLNKILKCDLTTNLPNNDIGATYSDLLHPIYHGTITLDQTRLGDESQLYHSEFYMKKYFYDNFQYTVKLENVIYSPAIWKQVNFNNIYLDYQVSNGIKSAFMFTINNPDQVTRIKYEQEDYDRLIYVNRNNEVSTYDNAYLNYIRTGYNYDVKNKNRNRRLALLGMFTGFSGSLLSVGTNLALGGANKARAQASLSAAEDAYYSGLNNIPYDKLSPVEIPAYKQGLKNTLNGARNISKATELAASLSSAATGVGIGMNVVNNVVNGIANISAQEQQLQQNLKQASMQATTVENADDLDLLKAYNGNKLNVAVYHPEQNMELLLKDLFYYTGIKVSYQGIPTHNSRVWFDFLQCSPVWKCTFTWDNEIISDLNSKFATGVTYFHKKNNKYDFDQELENWETWLLN